MSVHDGHRQRMKERFLEHGLEGFAEHEILELVLFYALPRGDVNETAHALTAKFGTLAQICDAPLEELKTVDGIGEHAALLLKMLPALSEKYTREKELGAVISSSWDSYEYIRGYFGGRTEEVYLFLLDAANKVFAVRKMGSGGFSDASFRLHDVVTLCARYQTAGVILAHNHPGGSSMPSEEDRKTTAKVQKALAAVDVFLLDHIIIAADGYFSFAESGYFEDESHA